MDINRENYREFDAINYSKLSSLVDHPSKVNQDKDFSDGMLQGDLIDLFCFDGEDKIREKYYVSAITQMPSDAIKEIIEQSPDYSDASLLHTARELEYGASTWKDSTIIRKIEEAAGEYIMELENAGDKRIISYEVYSECQAAANLLQNHQFTSRFFGNSWSNQHPIATDIVIDNDNTLKFKGLLDGVREDEDYIFVYDLKFTSSGLAYFPSDFFRWKYYLQAALYSDLAKYEINSEKHVIFHNVVYSSADQKVQVFRATDKMLNVGRNSGTKPNGLPIKGYKELALELKWHIDNDLWEYPYEVYANDGVKEIDFHGNLT